MLAEDRLDRNVQLDCEPDLYGDSVEISGPPAADHPTDLDIEFASLQPEAIIEHIDKWACGSVGVSDHLTFSFDPAFLSGSIDIARWLEGNASIEMAVPSNAVAPCDVLGRAAVCVEYTQDYEIAEVTTAWVIVIEDGTFDPLGVVLRLWSDDLPLDRLMQIAETIVPATPR